ncbi:SH3 domain-containing protein [Turicibacter bilis]|uniref:N-acetylmuramoyl-L-alanine amidase n=1 Tax=Turicibacter bilis TaxID=2735723 RepID=A0A9Q9CR61_9FIRM|nr:SH3 domain-containing protein [Turicibacter bilis]MBS3196903.1 SH3 domain-containing protein [Turicibacter bilis]UUF08422.1 SH3 domain-containing protein [Turicibacter bilis]
MSYIFKENLVSSSKYSIKCPYTMTPKYVVCHNTANDASAVNEISYMIGNNNSVSYHLAVDDTYVIQGIPFNRNAWHAGDGSSGLGNRYGIAVEICYSKSGGSKYTAAEENAVYVMARLLYQYDLGIDALKQHADFSAKNCPHRIRDEGRWNSVKSRVATVLNAIKNGQCSANLSSGTTTISSSDSPGESPSLPESNFTVKVICDELNIRKEASFTSQVVGTVKKGEVYTIVEVSNGLGRLKSGVGWISMGTDYVEKVTVDSSSTSTDSSSSFTVKVICNELNIRKEASFTSQVVGTVKKGDVYTIVEVSNGLGRLKSGAGWISMGTDYVEKVTTTSSSSSSGYQVKIVNCSVLNVRSGAGTSYPVVTTVKANEVYTIVDESNGFGKLKSGAGWISLSYTKKI